MLNILKELCTLNATSGDEGTVRKFIISKIQGFCDYKVDALGNIIAFKKGAKASERKVMLDAHMDEVGLIITSVTADGYLKFATVGGINTENLLFRKVKINHNLFGIISGKPIHLLSGDERKKLPKAESLYIDIGASSKEEALSLVNLGDRAVICGDFSKNGDLICSKALDDRIGCAILISLLRESSEYDFYATFTVQEEIGTRGAKTAAFSVNPDFALVLEGTTASDIADVPEEKTVCNVGEGATVSFMDLSAMYDKALFDAAVKSNLKVQVKRAVAGGNNSGSIQQTGDGARTLAISVPCRYIHSASSVASVTDIESALALTKYMLKGISSGEIK